MLTGLLLGVQISSVQTTSPHRAADHASAEPSRRTHDDIERIAGMRAIDVDAIHPNVGGIDIVGSPILFIDDDVLAAFDRTIEPSDGIVGDNEVSFDGSHDSDGEDPDNGEDDLDRDWPLFIRGRHDSANDDSGRELRLHADDPREEAMHASGLFIRNGGGLAPTVDDGMIDLFRHRDPTRIDGIVDFYVL